MKPILTDSCDHVVLRYEIALPRFLLWQAG
jgi:hypothetical protein